MKTKSLILALLGATACTSSGRTTLGADGDSAAAAGQALMRSVTIAGSKVGHGDLPKASNERVTLKASSIAAFAPGSSVLLSLSVDNPDQDQNPGKAVLMQFDGATDHLEVPVSSSDSGPAQLAFQAGIAGDACKDLCNRKFNLALQEALSLKDGTVSMHATQDLELDCTKKGDAARCAKGKGSAGSGASGAGSDAGDGGKTDGNDSVSGPSDGAVPEDGGLQGLGDAAFGFSDAGVLEIPCGDGSQVPVSAVCDGKADCKDGADELGCGDASVGADMFPCLSGGSVPLDKLCDGTMDCSDGYDEMICVPCADGMGQYSPYQQCDGTAVCADGTDEAGCNFTCTNGEQIPTAKFCDGVNDCSDGSDETPCQFPCGDGTTVPPTKVCDGVNDCANGADEDKSMCP